MGKLTRVTDVTIRKAKPRGTAYKITVGEGLYLQITPSGGKLWRQRYRFNKREKTLSLGQFPAIGLAEARQLRDNARKQLANGLDPSAVKRAEKVSRGGSESFEVLAREWHEKRLPTWAESTAMDAIQRLEKNIFPYLGQRPARDISSPELLAVLRRMESRGAHETAKRTRSLCSQIFKYGVASGLCETDPSAALQGALTKAASKSFAAIVEPRGVGQLMRSIDSFEGTLTVQIALKLSPLLAVRPGELRHAVWGEIDLDDRLWTIPALKMKKRRDHLVPLSRQAVELFRELRPVTDRGRDSFCFPSIRGRGRPMSENTVNSALRRLGYAKEEVTAHGFRSMFSSLLNDQGWDSRWIELQLAHVKGGVAGRYNRALHLDDRQKMLQHWSDYLDQLKSGVAENVVNLKSRKVA